VDTIRRSIGEHRIVPLLLRSRTSNLCDGLHCKAWLLGILFNVVRQERRKWFKWLTGASEDVAELNLVAPQQVPETLTDANIFSALDDLPAQFREVSC
jgi:hypothetical protein